MLERALAIVMLGGCAVSARAQDAAGCHGTPSPAVTAARQALAKDPSGLATLISAADALKDQGCYTEAVHVLEEGQQLHPHDVVLDARLRSARSMISEQNYIESVTRAEESARLQRNVLRCRKLGDIGACDEALSVRRNDPELLAARASATAQTQASVPQVSAPATPAAAPAVTPRTAAVRTAAATFKPKAVVYSNTAPVSRSN